MSYTFLSHEFRAMGGPCECHLWLDSDELEAVDGIVNELEGEVRRLETKYSRFNPDSLLSQINSGLLNNQPLDSETTGLLAFANDCFELSGHMFDPTVGILRTVWDYNADRLPDPKAVDQTLDRIGWDQLGWTGQSLSLPEGMQLDLGGLVKEFAVDRLCTVLKARKCIGLVNLAGDIGVSAPQPDNKPWIIGVPHPRDSGAIAQVALIKGAIAGSGDYERYMIVDGKRYSHLLRPDTGYPVIDGLCSVNVLADQCILAGSVSTIAMLKGDEGIAWLESIELPYLAFDQTLRPYGSIEVLNG